MGQAHILCACPDQEVRPQTRYLKILLIGAVGVGKTSIINQLCFGKFVPRTSQTISHTSYTYSYSNTLKVTLIDTSGVESHLQCLTPSMIASADAILYVYSVVDDRSLRVLGEYQRTVMYLGRPEMGYRKQPRSYLVGNKLDLLNETGRQKSSHDLRYENSFLIAASLGLNLEYLVQTVVEDIISPASAYLNYDSLIDTQASETAPVSQKKIN